MGDGGYPAYLEVHGPRAGLDLGYYAKIEQGQAGL